MDPLLIILAIFAIVALGLNIYTVYGEEDGGRDSKEAKFEWVEPVSNRFCLCRTFGALRYANDADHNYDDDNE